MKKLLLQLIFLAIFFPAISQDWLSIDGTVTDIANGNPVPNHAITILSDSTYGILYYNTVYTDSTGHYSDTIVAISDSIRIIYVQTFDCNDILHQSIIYYNPANNHYTQDFQICTPSIQCQAQFSYYPEPQGSPDSFQFIDLSIGNIVEWSWSFGDSTFSGEQNPVHSYPGPGTYNACLIVTGYDCSSTFCQDIYISDTVYHQLYGQVYSGNFPTQMGTVMLFSMDPYGNYSPFGDEFVIDSNGVYYFTLVADGNYLIWAIPPDSGGYLPTYYGNVVNWQQAAQVVPDITGNPYNINLAPAGQMTYGPGSVSGRIINTGLRNTVMDKINMILADENRTVIGFSRVSSLGAFDFSSLDYGTYYLLAELPGVTSDNFIIEITAEKPHAEIVLNFSGNSILGIDDADPAKEMVSVYPNPVRDQLNISADFSAPARLEIEIFTIAGLTVYRSSGSCVAGPNTFSIPFDEYPDGIYLLRIHSADGLNIIRKVIKQN